MLSPFSAKVHILYLTKKSKAIDGLLKTCERLLSENQYSGLSVLPICSHPEFSEKHIDLIPDMDRYLEAMLCAEWRLLKPLLGRFWLMDVRFIKAPFCHPGQQRQ